MRPERICGIAVALGLCYAVVHYHLSGPESLLLGMSVATVGVFFDWCVRRVRAARRLR